MANLNILPNFLSPHFQSTNSSPLPLPLPALHVAALHGRVAVVRALLAAPLHRPAAAEAAADPKNVNGDTPLMFAASAGHLGVAAALLKVRPVCLHTPLVPPSLRAAVQGGGGVGLNPNP